MKRSIFSMFAVLALAAIGCAQAPPATSHVVNLSWTAPSSTSTWTGCTTAAPCTYALYRAPANSSGVCPASTSASYAEVTNPASRPSGTSFTDPTAGGLTVCYIAETVQGASNSAPSNTTASITVPGTPTAPALNNPTAAQNQMPLLVRPALPELASLPEGAGELHLIAQISR